MGLSTSVAIPITTGRLSNKDTIAEPRKPLKTFPKRYGI